MAGAAVFCRFFSVLLFVNVKNYVASVAADQHHGFWTMTTTLKVFAADGQMINSLFMLG